MTNWCDACGGVIAADAQFCSHCGNDLRARRVGGGPGPRVETVGERRMLTVVFCDLVGSTELSSRVDAEEFSELIQTYLHRAVEVAQGYSGEVEHYAAITGVYATREVVAPIAESGFQVMFHTFAALPSACAAADAVLGIIEREKLVERARTMGARLSDRLHARLGQHPHVAEIRGLGLLQAVEIVADRDTLTPFDQDKNVTNRVVGKALNHGVFFYPGGTGVVRDIITLGPPLISTEADIDLMAEVLETAINEALA